MTQCNLTQTEQMRRKEIADHTRTMVVNLLQVDAEDETSIMCGYRDYYLQISFSELHPLMVVCLAKALTHPGSHAINEEVGCYSYRATHWLDTELDAERFFEILNRCVDEANRGFLKLAG